MKERESAKWLLALPAAMALTLTLGGWAIAYTPLNDLGSGLYLDQFEGGLYPDGSNELPAQHAAEGLSRALAIQPLNTLGEPDPEGKYVLVSIGMSNTTQEFCSGSQPGACQPWSFMGQAAAHPAVNDTALAIINGAAGGKSAAFWDSPLDPDYDRVVDEWLTPSGLSEQQVQAAWVKVANPRPTISLPHPDADAYQLVEQMGDIARALKVRYPNLQQVYFSSRIYAGYATTELNPEPYAYESGLAVKWLIEAQINQMTGGSIDPLAGDLDYTSGIAPWIAWGPYLWADGLNPRSDGLTWEQNDFNNDGTHPSQSGREKVGTMLLDFMLSSPFTQAWFLDPSIADYNANGTVDAADYTVWQDTLGSTTSLAADGDASGTVDAGDYDVWKLHFGETAAVGAASPAAQNPPRLDGPTAPVPEPAAFWSLATGIIAVAAFSRAGWPSIATARDIAAMRYAD